MRGQSETLGFVVIFSLIAVSTGVVYVGGFNTLEDVRHAEETRNMERAFEVLDDNLRDIANRGAPSRATELSLGNGDISLGDSVRITVSADFESNGTEAANVTVGTHPVTYRNDETEIVYTAGAIIRSDRGNAIMRSEPNWLVSDRQTVIPLLVTSPAPDSPGGMSGSTTILVLGERQSRTLAADFEPSTTRANVTVTIESSRAEAWKPFLERKGFTAIDGDPSDGKLTYWFLTDELYVPRTVVEIGFRP